MSGDILSISRVSEGVKAKHLPAVLLFIGFFKAFDSIQKKKKKCKKFDLLKKHQMKP